MPRFSSFRILLLLALCLAVAAGAQETHLTEAGSGAILSRSAFAHGYRHGYEEGYHLGNVDINMARDPRVRLKAQFHGLKIKLGYVPSFGSKRSFEDGFEAGLKAGYSDGYAGRTFRAVDALRLLAVALESAPPPEDPGSVYFDQGLASGYRDGWQQEGSYAPGMEPLDFHRVACVSSHPGNQPDSPVEDSYCEGYKRGFVLGHGDAWTLHRDSVFLEASK